MNPTPAEDRTGVTLSSLDGLVVGIPAARRAAETARLVERWGGTPLVGPTLREVPVPDEGPLREATNQIISSPLRWSVHLTGVGTRRWLTLAEDWGLLQPLMARLTSANLVPRGGKARAALGSYGLQPAWVPEGETSREIAVWLSDHLQGGDRVALQRHGDPVPHLVERLEDTGAHVIEVVPYGWDLPEDVGPAERLVTALVEGDAHALVITSAPQIRHLFILAGQQERAEPLRKALQEDVFLAAVGTVAAEGLRKEGLPVDLVANPPRMGALIRALAESRGQILEKSAAQGTPKGTPSRRPLSEHRQAEASSPPDH